MENFESHWFECTCSSDNHAFRFTFDQTDSEMYLSVQLHQHRNWWQRAWTGLRYIFGYTSKYGHWDCTILDRDAIERLHMLCERSLATMNSRK